MKKFLFIAIVFSVTACSMQRNVSELEKTDEENVWKDCLYDSEVAALQYAKERFFMLDSAMDIINNVGWAKRMISTMKITEGPLPSVGKLVQDDAFRAEMPCWEFSTEDYYGTTVIAEHTNLDSAIVSAKIYGVDMLMPTIPHRIQNGVVDSIEYFDHYLYCMKYVEFSCLCVTKYKKSIL